MLTHQLLWNCLQGFKVLVIPRFLSKVKIINDCWIWQAYISKNGYAKFGYDGVVCYAHRFIYEYFHGQICPDLELDHLCRNRACVNPVHLEQVSHTENMKRGLGGINNKIKTHCPKGHPYTPENIYRNKGKWRICRSCILAR